MNVKYLDLSYIRLLKKYLWYTGFWPGEALGEHIPLYIKWHRIQIVVQNVIGFVGQAWYIVENFTQMPFVVAGLLYIVASLTVLMAAKCSLTNFKGYQEIIRKLLQEFHLIHHSRGGAYEKKIIAKVDKISHYCTVYHMAIIFFIVLTFNGIPIFNSYKAGAFRGRNLSGMKLELAIYFRYPGFECLDYFYLLSFLNIYFTYIGAVAMFAIDAIVSAIIFQIIGHILILKHDIENLPEPKRETVVVFPHTGYEGHLGERVRLRLYDDEENKYIHNVLVGIINPPVLASNFVTQTVACGSFRPESKLLYFLETKENLDIIVHQT